MSPIEQQDAFDRYVKGVTYKNIWAIVVCTFISCSTAFSIYYGIKEEMNAIRAEIRFIEYRLQKLESK